jgi:hypothetical protein
MSVREESSEVTALMYRLASHGVSFRAEGGRLFVRAPAGLAEGELELVRRSKPAVLAYVERADAALAETLDLLDWARRRHGKARGAAGVAESYALAAQGCRDRLDPLLFDAPDAVRAWLARIAEPAASVAGCA